MEILIVLVVLGILTTLAKPAFDEGLAAIRAHRALDRVTAELYRVRMSAVESGTGARLIALPDPDGCVRWLRMETGLHPPDTLIGITLPLDLPALCLRHSGDSLIVFNGRGMLRPPTRSFFVTHGSTTDSLLISIAGRVRRTYRRRPSARRDPPGPG